MAILTDGVERRTELLRGALRLEWLTVGWNVVEGVIAVAAALAAGSVALLGFGIDSFVESASGGVLIWRLLAERRGALDRAASRAGRGAGNDGPPGSRGGRSMGGRSAAAEEQPGAGNPGCGGQLAAIAINGTVGSRLHSTLKDLRD